MAGNGSEHNVVMQVEKAGLLPVSVAGVLMPNPHVGHGLPAGGVPATENAVIPCAVGEMLSVARAILFGCPQTS
jgi:tRNA-splicing ligase RtcB